MAQLRDAGFGLAATLVEGGDDVFRAALPARLVYVMGAEGEGMDRALASQCDQQCCWRSGRAVATAATAALPSPR
ncbi:hypothetical protein G6F46_015610 [Rhizopus delemar]|nr:hypothetical protein G6F46_015610 [Rhizopus delemar]